MSDQAADDSKARVLLVADLFHPVDDLATKCFLNADVGHRFSGYHLYYPSRRQPAAFALLVDTLREPSR